MGSRTPSAPLGPRWEAAHTPLPPGLLGTVVSPALEERAAVGPAAAQVPAGSAQPQQLGLVKSFGPDANPTIVSASIVPISFVLHQVSEQFWCMRTAFFQM